MPFSFFKNILVEYRSNNVNFWCSFFFLEEKKEPHRNKIWHRVPITWFQFFFSRMEWKMYGTRKKGVRQWGGEGEDERRPSSMILSQIYLIGPLDPINTLTPQCPNPYFGPIPCEKRLLLTGERSSQFHCRLLISVHLARNLLRIDSRGKPDIGRLRPLGKDEDVDGVIYRCIFSHSAPICIIERDAHVGYWNRANNGNAVGGAILDIWLNGRSIRAEDRANLEFFNGDSVGQVCLFEGFAEAVSPSEIFEGLADDGASGNGEIEACAYGEADARLDLWIKSAIGGYRRREEQKGEGFS